jgi:NAD+ synthase (glutamine-hydrolysing)
MENYGFYKVAVAIPELKVADCEFNVRRMKDLILKAGEQGIHTLCFPELSVTGYTCGDLFLQKALLQKAEDALNWLIGQTVQIPVCFIVGAPVEFNSKLYNCAIVCLGGHILGIVPKVFLPNYSEFYEKRWFESYALEKPVEKIEYADETVPFGSTLLFKTKNGSFAVEICEDLWSVIPPSSSHAMSGAKLIFNLSASDELIGKQQYVQSLISQQSARCHSAYVYVSAGFGESSTDVVYAGNAYIYENGRLLARSERFQFTEQLIGCEIDFDLLDAERRKNTTFIGKTGMGNYAEIKLNPWDDEREILQLSRFVNPAPFIPSLADYSDGCEEIFSIQVAGLAKRFLHTQAKTLLVGVSGGLDSTLALLVCVKTADKLGLSREIVCGVTMPGFGTSARTHGNALRLMKSLGITVREISILDACKQHFNDIGHDLDVHDLTYENTQARERTQILMDLANRLNGLVIGTGDMSELALGWATYNGDHISMYGVNAGIPKTLVRHLVKWVAENQIDETARETLADIIRTPVSPELLPVDSKGKMTQFTEDLVGPYELHDFFLFYTLRYGFTPDKIYFLAKQAFKETYQNPEILRWMRVFFLRFFSQQFNRSCMPDGPKVGSVNLSPRGDWRMPSDACVALWLEDIEKVEKN